MPEPGAEVPAVVHPRLVHAHAARATDLRLALGRSVHHDREQVLGAVGELAHVDVERPEHALVPRELAAVHEHRARAVDAFEAQRAIAEWDGDPTAIDPVAGGGPLRAIA